MNNKFISHVISPFLFFSVSAFLFTGCKSTLPPISVESVEYHLQAADMVNVEVYGEADISRAFKVSADGHINHPLLGRVGLVGLSLPDAEKLIHSLLEADYFVDPIVTVSIKSSSNRPVIIFGEVRSPGSYEMSDGRRHTLLQVIALAGGFTDIAAMDKVRIVRMSDGKEQTIVVRVTDLLRGKKGVNDVDLRPGDVITVPETIF